MTDPEPMCRPSRPLLAAILLLAAATGCTRRGDAPRVRYGAPPPRPEPALYQSEVEEGIGAAIMVVVDTSGSMKERVPGDPRPKHEIAREALETMLAATDELARKRPEFAVKVGIMHFSSGAWIDLPMQAHDLAKQKAALARIPAPGGGTAIGKAMLEARPELYRSGVFRKYVLVVTDGENTTGPSPAKVAREIHRRSEGAVQTYFVAFDTSPEKFAFLAEVGGAVVPAQNGAELQTALREIYQGKILAEALDVGETGTDERDR